MFQTGSMTAAGALMGVTQPAVSRLVRDFEAEIKIPLFDRKGGRISATPDAVALYQEVQRSFHGLDRVARAAAELGRRRGVATDRGLGSAVVLLLAASHRPLSRRVA